MLKQICREDVVSGTRVNGLPEEGMALASTADLDVRQYRNRTQTEIRWELWRKLRRLYDWFWPRIWGRRKFGAQEHRLWPTAAEERNLQCRFAINWGKWRRAEQSYHLGWKLGFPAWSSGRACSRNLEVHPLQESADVKTKDTAMLIFSLDYRGTVHRKFVSLHQIVSQKRFLKNLERTQAHSASRQGGFTEEGS